MKGKTLSNQTARQAVETRGRGNPRKILSKDLGSVGSGDKWDESRADRVTDRLLKIQRGLEASGKKIDAFGFDRIACEIVHRELDLPPNLAASDGFWRWLAVAKFSAIIEARHAPASSQAHLGNYGIDKSVTSNRMAILWLRADMLYDADATRDPYHLAKYHLHADFLESGIIRPRYAWCRNLSRALVRFQYRSPESDSAFLHSTHENGIRELYKRLRRLHPTVAFEFISDDELENILQDKSRDLKRA